MASPIPRRQRSCPGGRLTPAPPRRPGPWPTTKRRGSARAPYSTPTAGKITFADYFETSWFPNKGGEVNTLAKYEMHYRACPDGPVWGRVQLRRVLSSSVQGWVTRMVRDGVTPVTVQARFTAFQTVIAGRKGVSALRDGLIQADPFAGCELPTVPGLGDRPAHRRGDHPGGPHTRGHGCSDCEAAGSALDDDRWARTR